MTVPPAHVLAAFHETVNNASKSQNPAVSTGQTASRWSICRTPAPPRPISCQISPSGCILEHAILAAYIAMAFFSPVHGTALRERSPLRSPHPPNTMVAVQGRHAGFRACMPLGLTAGHSVDPNFRHIYLRADLRTCGLCRSDANWVNNAMLVGGVLQPQQALQATAPSASSAGGEEFTSPAPPVMPPPPRSAAAAIASEPLPMLSEDTTGAPHLMTSPAWWIACRGRLTLLSSESPNTYLAHIFTF